MGLKERVDRLADRLQRGPADEDYEIVLDEDEVARLQAEGVEFLDLSEGTPVPTDPPPLSTHPAEARRWPT